MTGAAAARSRFGWALGGGLVACLLLPDLLLAAPSTVRTGLALACAAGVALVLGRPRALEALRSLLARPATAHVLLAAWVAVGLGLQALKLRAFSDVHGQDQAYHVQVLWNTLQGRFGQGSVLQELYFDPPLANHGGLHVSVAFATLLPLFAVVPHVGTLLVVKVLAAGAGAALLLRLASGVLDRASATAVLAAYLLHPTVLGQWTHDFYPEALAAPALMLVFLAWERRRIAWFAAALAALLSVREDLGFTACAFTAVAVLERLAGGTSFRGWRWAVLPAALGIAWYVVAARVLMPWGGGQVVASNVTRWYGGYGDTPAEIVRRMLLDPVHTLTVAFASAKVLYLWQMLRPFAALPLLGRAAVVALPAAAINILVSEAGPTLDPNGHYSFVVAGALAVAAVAVVGHVSARSGPAQAFALCVVLLGSALTAVPDALNATSVGRLRRPAHAAAIEAALALVPPHATVAAPSDYLSLVACAPVAYAVDRFGHYPPDLGRPEAVVLDLDPVRARVLPERRDRYAARVAWLLADPGYERALDRDGIVLLLRRDGGGAH